MEPVAATSQGSVHGDAVTKVPRILVVDDEPDIEALISQIFRRAVRASQLELRFAADGQEALDRLRADPDIDMVLTDINMPRMDGLTLLSHLAEVNPLLKAVIVSAYGDMDNIRTAMNRGAFDFLTKPIDLADLQATVAKTLGEVERIREMVRQREAAERATRAKSEFVAMVSHEVRTPMNAVLGMASFLLDTSLTAEQREYAETIVNSGQALLAILDDILDFSKIEAGKLVLETTEFRLQDVIEGVIDLMSTRAAEKGLELSSLVSPSLPPLLRGDPARLRQIVINLVGNAVKFTAAGHVAIRVGLATSPQDGWAPGVVQVIFEIEDSGIGLDAKQQSRLFEAFSQADISTTREYGGTGLGLSICRRLVQLMGGRIGVRSESGVGSTFWFSVPMEPLPANGVGHAADLSGLRVALVTSRPRLRAVLDAYLPAAGAAVLDSADEAADVILIDHQAGEDARDAALASDGATPVLVVATREASPSRMPGVWGDVAGEVREPLRRDQLYLAVARAVGRLDDDPVVGDSAGGVSAQYLAPSIEAARAAGALVLVAEDNPMNRAIITKQMERLGYAIVVAEDGEAAWQAWRDGRFGLLLVDCHMPRLDGFDLAERIRQVETRSGARLPIVALTADVLRGTAERCYAAGMDDYLSKPVETGKLDSVIRRWLPAAARMRQPVAAGSLRAAAPAGDAEAGGGVLDISVMVRNFGEIDDEVRGMFAVFIDTTRPLIERLRAEIGEARLEQAAGTAHTAKGAAGYAGASELQALLAEIEAALREGQSDAARTRTDELGAAWRRIEAAIAQL